MSQKNFFQQLKDELHGHPFRDRFLEELEDHAEDLKADEELKENSITSEMMKKYLGETKEVKNIFLNIMNPFRKIFFILEGLFFGMFLLPFTIILHIYLRFITFPESGFPMGYAGLVFLGGLSLLFIYYKISFKRFFELEINLKPQPFKWYSLIIVPNLIAFSILVIKQPNHLLEQGSGLILLILSYLGLNLISSFLAWSHEKKQRSKRISKDLSKVFQYIKLGLLIYFFVSIVVRTALFNTSVKGDISSPIYESFYNLFSIFSLIIPIEFFTFSWWGMALSSGTNEINIFTVFYLPIFILLFIGIQSLWVVIKQKKWFSLRSLVIFYIISLFLIPGESFISDHEFKVTVTNISEKIEKNEVGIFYPMLKYFNSDEGSLFKYEVGFIEESPLKSARFVIKSNIGNISYIPYESLTEGDFELQMDSNETQVPSSINLPHYYDCDRKDIDNCNIYNFVDQYIAKIGLPVSDAAFSKDGKWGLIVLANGSYDPEEVYLVRLK